MRVNHNLFIVEQKKFSGIKDGFRQYESTGKSAAICACGLSTGFKKTEDIYKAVDDHTCPLDNRVPAKKSAKENLGESTPPAGE